MVISYYFSSYWGWQSSSFDGFVQGHSSSCIHPGVSWARGSNVDSLTWLASDIGSWPGYLGSPICGLSSSRRLDQLHDMAASRYHFKMARAEATMSLYTKAPDFIQYEFHNILLARASHMATHNGKMGKQMPPSMEGDAKALWPSEIDQTPV